MPARASVRPDVEPPFPYVFDMAMGVTRSNTTLQRELDDVIAQRRADIEQILQAYGVPIVRPEKVAVR